MGTQTDYFTEWWDKYQPDTDEDGCVSRLYETYGDDLATVKATPMGRVWTVIEGDGQQFIVSGMHYVNRVGYFITRNEWEHDNIIVPLEGGDQ
jgi:hypothetical protein